MHYFQSVEVGTMWRSKYLKRKLITFFQNRFVELLQLGQKKISGQISRQRLQSSVMSS